MRPRCYGRRPLAPARCLAATAREAIDAAAAALGGAARLRRCETITLIGYGQYAYQNGGGNISPLPGRAAEVHRRQRLSPRLRPRARAHAAPGAAQRPVPVRQLRRARLRPAAPGARRRRRLQHQRAGRRPRAAATRATGACGCTRTRSSRCGRCSTDRRRRRNRRQEGGLTLVDSALKEGDVHDAGDPAAVELRRPGSAGRART